MRDKPIYGKGDANYYIKYNSKAHSDYIKYFKKDNDDVIFLNGKWGSGKTSYLNIVLEENNKEKFQKKILKKIDLWRITTNQKTSEIFYRSLFPISGFITRYAFILLFLIFSGLAVYLSNISPSSYLATLMNPSANSTTTYFFFISGILSGLTQTIGRINYDSFFLLLLKKRTSRFLLWQKRIVIIDDFDRIEPSRQEELYKIFNLLTSKKIKFVFLGDYSIIQKNQDNYLQKIIDRRIELPYELSPSNYWSTYFDDIIKTIEEKREDTLSKEEKTNLDTIKDTLIIEGRTLREKHIFDKYVCEILFSGNRYDLVNLDQQFLTIYLYLFHNNSYNILVNKIDKLLEPYTSVGYIFAFKADHKRAKKELERIKKVSVDFFEEEGSPSIVTKLIQNILLSYDDLYGTKQNKTYKYYDFITKFPNYFINYIPLNIGGKEIKKILTTPYTRKQTLKLLKSDTKSDIYNYLRRNQNQLTEEEKENLFNLAIEFVCNLDDKYTHDINMDGKSLHEEVRSIVNLGLYLNKQIDLHNSEKSLAYLQTILFNKLDISAQLRFCEYYLYMKFTDLPNFQKEVTEIAIKSDKLKTLSYPEYIFHFLYLSHKGLTHRQLNNLLSLPDINFYCFITRYTTDHGINEIQLTNIPEEQVNQLKSRYRKMNSIYRDKLNIKLVD